MEKSKLIKNPAYCCVDGIITCPGCDGEKKSEFGVCAGCEGVGLVGCGKCGGNELKQETLEEAADKYGFRVPYDGSNDFYDKEVIKHFIAGAKWQAERMYSEEDLKSAFFNGGGMKDIEEFNYWLEQFKKK